MGYGTEIINLGSPKGRQPKLGSSVRGLVALNFVSAQGVKGAPPLGNNLGSKFSTSQTPEISGTAPWRAPFWARVADGSASSATAALEKIKNFRIKHPIAKPLPAVRHN